MSVRGVVFSALFAALLVVFSYIRITLPFTPVPIVVENLVPMFAGAFLGAGYGFFSMVLVLVLTAFGVPMLGGSGGLGVIFGATGGYVVAWPFNALLIGLLIKYVKGIKPLSWVQTFVIIEVFGALFPYVIAVPWLALSIHVPIGKAVVMGCYPFLVGDTVKAVVATVIVVLIRQVFPTQRLVGRGGAGVVKIDG